MSALLKAVKLLVAGSVCLLACSCSTVTNLTPTTVERSAGGSYLFEVDWDTNDNQVRPNSLEASVLLDGEAIPMEPSPAIPDRWSVWASVDPKADVINFRYKLEYLVKGLVDDVPRSKLSDPYQLRVVEVDSRPVMSIP